MNLSIVTIVFDGEPFIEWHLPIFSNLTIPWQWIVVEGSAQNKGSTAWCKPQSAQASTDGTNKYLDSLKDKRVTVIHKAGWQSKDEQINAALSKITEPCVLLEIDVDEIHTKENIERIVNLFENDPGLGVIKMPCRYFVGPDLVCVGNNCWSNKADEWIRAWRFSPGMKFRSHEPPVLEGVKGRMMEKYESRRNGLSFDHLAYSIRSQAEYKEKFYGYDGLTNQWESLQENTHWPAKLSRFFPFVPATTLVEKI